MAKKPVDELSDQEAEGSRHRGAAPRFDDAKGQAVAVAEIESTRQMLRAAMLIRTAGQLLHDERVGRAARRTRIRIACSLPSLAPRWGGYAVVVLQRSRTTTLPGITAHGAYGALYNEVLYSILLPL